MAALRIAGDISYVVDEDEAVILDRRSGHYFGLNRSATTGFILLLAHSKASAIERYRDQYRLAREWAEHDIYCLIDLLLERGIVQYGEMRNMPS